MDPAAHPVAYEAPPHTVPATGIPRMLVTVHVCALLASLRWSIDAGTSGTPSPQAAATDEAAATSHNFDECITGPFSRCGALLEFQDPQTFPARTLFRIWCARSSGA